MFSSVWIEISLTYFQLFFNVCFAGVTNMGDNHYVKVTNSLSKSSWYEIEIMSLQNNNILILEFYEWQHFYHLLISFVYLTKGCQIPCYSETWLVYCCVYLVSKTLCHPLQKHWQYFVSVTLVIPQRGWDSIISC